MSFLLTFRSLHSPQVRAFLLQKLHDSRFSIPKLRPQRSELQILNHQQSKSYLSRCLPQNAPFHSSPGGPRRVPRPCKFHMACYSRRITVASPTLSLITESINKRIHFLHRLHNPVFFMQQGTFFVSFLHFVSEPCTLLGVALARRTRRRLAAY